MNKFKIIPILIVICIFINSCFSNKTTIFLAQCNERKAHIGDKYCLVTILEIKNNLSGGRLFYVGSDNMYHYFYYDNTKPIKISANLKINKKELMIKYTEFNKDDTKHPDKFPVYISDL